MFKRFLLTFIGVLLLYAMPVTASRLSHSAPRKEVIWEPPQRWHKRFETKRQKGSKNILLGMNLGVSSFSGLSSLITRDQEESYVKEVMEGMLSSPRGLSLTFFSEYQFCLARYFWKVNGELGWSNVRTAFNQLYPKKKDRLTLENPCSLKQIGLLGLSLIAGYGCYFLKPFVKMGVGLSGFKFNICPDVLCGETFTRHFVTPGLLVGCGLEASWQNFGVRLSYTYTMHRRWERRGNDPLGVRGYYVIHKISGLEQHTLALSTFARF